MKNEILSEISSSIVGATVGSTNTSVLANSVASIPKTFTAGVAAALVGATGNRADADIKVSTKAFTQSATLLSSNTVEIRSTATNTAKAGAYGGALGAIAIGAMIADVTLGLGQDSLGNDIDEVIAEAGSNTKVIAGTLLISASTTDDLLAESVAAGGGLVAATGSQSNTFSDNAAIARLGADTQVTTNSFQLKSTGSQKTDASADSYAFALGVGTGAGASNKNYSKANVDVGTNALVTSQFILISAKNELTKDRFKDASNLRAGSASVAGLTVLTSDTEIGNSSRTFQANVNIASGAQLTATGNNNNPGVFRIETSTDVTAVDSVRIETASGFSVSVGLSEVTANTDANINVTGAKLENQSGDLFLTSRTGSGLRPSANVLMAGSLSGAVGADAKAIATANSTITVTNSDLRGSDVLLYTGRDSTGVPNLHDSFANVEITAFSLLPNIVVPVVKAEINENNVINLTGTTQIRALEDVNLLANEGVGGDKRAGTSGLALSLSLLPYGFPVPKGNKVTSTNLVNIASTVKLEAGLNARSIVLLKPVTDNEGPDLNPMLLGTELTAAQKTALFTSDGVTIPNDIRYEYGRLNLENIAFTVSAGTIIKVVDDLDGNRVGGGGDVDSFYQYRNSAAGGDLIILETENFGDTNRWTKLTTMSIEGNRETGTPGQPSIAEAAAALAGSSSELAVYESDVTQKFAETLKDQFYVIKPVTLAAPTITYQNLGGLLIAQRQKILDWMTSHALNAEAIARYEVQLAVVEETLADFGLLESLEVEGQTITVVKKQLDTLFVNLPAVYSAPGSIFVEGNVLSQVGVSVALANQQLITRAGSEIVINNQTPYSMVLDDVIVRDNKRVDVVDGKLTVLKPGNVYFNGHSLTTVNDTTEPTITVTQKALSPLSRYALTVPDVDLGLYLVGDLVNEAGSATIKNFEGSITVSGEVRAKTVDIQAATDFTLNTEDWFHTNKDPRQYLDYDALRIAAFNNGSGTIFQAGSTNSVYTTALANLNTAINTDNSKILAQGRIAITARYLNIDGLIQSGVQTVTVNVASNFRSNDTKSFLDNTGKPISGISFGTDGVPVEGYFDAEKQAIVIDDIVPSGGRIIIAGQILSTGNGRLKVAYGYANVDIQNDSPYQTIVNRIDTTKYREGKITLVDTARASGPYKKEYVVAPDGTVTETTFNGTLQTEEVEIGGSDAVVSSINYVLQSTVAHSPGSAITFSPEAGLRYIWTEGQEKTQTIVTKYEKNSFNLLGDNGLADALAKDNSWTKRDVFYTDKKPLLESESATNSLPGSQAYMLGDAYTIEYVQKRNEAVTVTPGITVVRFTYPLGIALENLLFALNPSGRDTANGIYGHYYRYKGPSETKLILPELNYKDTALWEDLGTSGTENYLSTFRNYTLTTEKWTTGGGWLRNKTRHTLTTEITGLKDFYTHSLDADQPIAISFVGGASNPQININSVGNLLIQGNIDNTATGTTNLTSTLGDVTVAGSSAIFGASPTVTAGDDVRIAIEGDKGPLNITDGGDIRVDVIGETGPASLSMGLITTTDGNVFLNAPDGVESEDSSSCVEGDFIQILTINGSVGTSTLPLSINSDVNETGGLAIRAEGGIFVTEKVGDLKLAQPTEWATPLASIESTDSGTITLRTTDGSIVDAWFDQFRAPSQAESDARDAQLALTGNAAREAAESAIRSDESAQTQLYHSYWQSQRNLTRGSVSSTLAIDTINATSNTITFADPHGLTSGAQAFFSIGVDLTAEDFTETMRWEELAPAYDLDTPPVAPVMLATNDYVQTVDGVLHRYLATSATVDLETTDFFDTTLWATVLPNHIVPMTSGGRIDLRTNQLVQDTDGKIYQYLGAESGQTNLTNGAEYFVIVVNSTTIKLATSRYDAAIAAPPVALDILLTGDAANFQLLRYNYTTSAYNAGQSVPTQFVALHASLSGASYNTDYVFQFTSGEKQARIDARTFSAGSLQFPVPASVFNALYPEMAFPAGFVVTPTSSETPNIIGSNVTLVTGGTAKNVGNLTAPTTLDLTSGFDGLSAADQQLLSQITVNDLFGVSHPVYQYVGTSGSVSLGTQNFSNTALWQKITPNFTSSGQTDAVSLATGNIVLAQTSKTAYGLYRFLGSNGSFKLSDENYSNTQRWQKITSNFNSGDGTVALNNGQLVTDRTKVESITFQLIDDVNVEASGNVSVDAGNNVALSTGGTLNLDHVRTSGNVRLQAVGSIVDQLVGGTAAAISTFGGVNLISGGFIAANATDPLRLQLAPSSPFSAEVTDLLNVVQVSTDVTINGVFRSISDLFVSQVNAGSDVKIVVQQGDLVIGTIATAADAILDAQRSILDAFDDVSSPVSNITAVDVTMTAGTNIGALGNFLDVQSSGKLNATAGTSLFIHGIGSLNLDRIQATTGDVYLSTTGSLLASQQDTTANVVGRYINLSALNGTIGTVSEPLDLDSSFSGTSKVDAVAKNVVVLTERLGDLRVGAITSNLSNVHLVAANSIVDADNDPASDVNGNDIHLTAQNGTIGVSSNDLEINTHFSGGSLLDAHATGDIYVTEVTEFLHVANAVSDSGNIRLTVNETSASGEDLIVGLGDLIEALLGSILLLVGDNVLIDVGGSVSSKTSLEIYGDHGNADPGTGANIDIDGSLSSTSIVIAGARDGDRIDISPQALVGHTRVLGDNDGLSGGEDTIILDQLPSVTTSHDRPNHNPISGSQVVRDTIDVDGRGGTDTYLINVSGSGSNYLVNVHDTGAPDDGADTLTINGTSAADVFLLREHFVALLIKTGFDSDNRPTFSNAVERINYDRTVNGRLLVSSGNGDDEFYVDDNSTITTLDGGIGKDTFQIGQIFGTNPNGYFYDFNGQKKWSGDYFDLVGVRSDIDERSVADDTQNIDLTSDNDEIALLKVTRGWLSRGISYPLTTTGGEGNDTFTVYSNKAVLRMEGESGNDTFVIRAFIADNDIIANGGNDDDRFEYNINAPISINGGLGFDTIVVLGTERRDVFIITDQGVFGAGLNIRLDGVEEALQVDGLEGDDTFYILSTNSKLVTTVIGGLGSDTFNIAGDVTKAVISQDLNGLSAVVNHGATSSTGNPYDKLLVDGIAVAVADPATQGKVIITESDGFSELVEDSGATDSYQISLNLPAGGLDVSTVAYLTVSAGLSSSYDRRLGKRNTSDGGPHDADSVLISINNGATWLRAAVLTFTAATWDVPKTVLFKDVHDDTLEGERKVMISHSLLVTGTSTADVKAFDRVAIPNVEVRVLDDDLGTLLVRESGNTTRVLEGDATSEITDTYEVKLSVDPTQSVTVDLSFSTAGQVQIFEASDLNTPITSLTILPGSNIWRTLVVKAINDGTRENTSALVIEHSFDTSDPVYATAPAVDLVARVFDNDSAGVLVTESNTATRVIKGGAGDDYTMRLVSDPQATVFVNLYGDGQTVFTGAQTVGLSDDRLVLRDLDASQTVTATLATNGAAADSITRTGSSWSASGFKIGTLFTINGGTTLFKINDITDTLDGETVVSSVLTLTTDANVTPGTNVSVMLQRKTFAVAFDSSNWFKEARISLAADTNFIPDPDRQFVRNEPVREHLTSRIGGPLIIEGGILEGNDRSIKPAVVLPTEVTGLPIDILIATDETKQADRLNVFNDSSSADDIGWMETPTLDPRLNQIVTLSAPINITGLGMNPDGMNRSRSLTVDISEDQDGSGLVVVPGGITFDDIEITEVMLGQGNDRFNISATSSGTAGASAYVVTVVHGGGNTEVSPGVMGGDTITVTGGGGSSSPLVIYGDTSQDGSRYDARPDLNLINGDAVTFANSGNDIIDASAISQAVVIYGGAGNDTLKGSQAGDHIAGGSGNDSIDGGDGNDNIYGDSGFNLAFDVSKNESDQALVARLLSVPVTDAATTLTRDGLAVGRDTINGDGGSDIVFGDHGRIDQTVGTLRIVTTGNVIAIQTERPSDGGNDTITLGGGNNSAFGGKGADTITGGTNDDFIVGDNGRATFDNVTLVRVLFATTEPSIGDDDLIDAANGNNIVLGGFGSDSLTTGTGTDIVIGDNGQATYTPNTTLLQQIKTTNPTLGGNDTIAAGAGDNLILGGKGSDSVTALGGADLVIGDNGQIDWTTAGVYQQIQTSLHADGAADTINGGDGNNTVLAGEGADSVTTGTGADWIIGDNGSMLFSGATVGNVVMTLESTDTVNQPLWNDTISGSSGANQIIGGMGADRITTSGNFADIVMGDNGEFRWNDSGVMTSFQTTQQDKGGNDNIDAADGNNIVLGGFANDTITTGAGEDLVLGDNGKATFNGSAVFGGLALMETTNPLLGGDDSISSGNGEDLVFGGMGADEVHGGGGHDVILGDHGRFDISLPTNQNFVSIFTSTTDGAGNDQLFGDTGDDFILGQQGDDSIYGGAGQDDLTGGHNVVSGADGNDRIYGGDKPTTPASDISLEAFVSANDGADVILGDNGQITRTITSTTLPTTWLTYVGPFPDVIRDVQRFDDADFIAGNDFLYGDAGQDSIHGQRGNDSIGGGSDDDELIGELGDDSIVGGSGNDILIADVGYIRRAFNADGSARLNQAGGRHHRDVYLEEVGTLVGSIDLDTTPLRITDPNLAQTILRADMIVLTGAYDANGQKHLQSDNGAWNTNLLAINLVAANNDLLAGGTGDDVLFGQRGNDSLNGDADNDSIFGDGATNLSSALTDLPHVFNGLRLIAAAGGLTNPVVLDQFGTSFMVPVTLNPEVMDLNAPYATSLSSTLVLPDVTESVLNQVGAQNPERADGTNLRPLVAFIPDVVQNVEVLPGNDTIDGGTGNDLIVGDNATVYSPLVTGFTEIDTAATDAQNALDLVRHSLRSLSADFDHLEHDVRNVVHSRDIRIGEDSIRGGDGIDNIFGDDALLLTPYISGLQVPQSRFMAEALAAHGYLADLQQAAFDLDSVVFEAHYQVLQALIAANTSSGSSVASGADHNHHDLFIGNDTIAAGIGDDLVFGDWGLLGTPIVSGIRLDQVQLGSTIDASIWEVARFVVANQETTRKAALSAHLQQNQNRLSRTIATATLSQLVADHNFDLTMGNDVINGNEGLDVLFGDFGIVVVPLVLQSPPLPGAQTSNLDQTIQVLLNDVGGAAALGVRRNSSYTSRNHLTTFNDLRARYRHPFFGERVSSTQLATILAGNDSILGDAGDDFVLGDSASLFVTYSTQTPTQRIVSPNPAFELSFLNRENFELAGHYRRDGGASRIASDTIRGGEGNDSLYGQHRDDSVFGEGGNDLAYGGDGQLNVADGGTGTNDARPRGDDRPVGIPLRNLQNRLFANLTGVFAAELVNLSEDPTPNADAFVFRTSDGGGLPTFDLVATMTSTDGFAGVRGQTRSFSLSTNAPSANEVGYIIDWGDATAKEFVSGSGTITVSHTFSTAAAYLVKVTAIDVRTTSSSNIQKSLTIGTTEVQGTTFAVGGTTGNDAIAIAPGWNVGEGVRVTFNGAVLSTITSSSLRRVAVFGGTGNDSVTVEGSAASDQVVLGESTLSINDVTVNATSIEAIRLNGSGGTDTLVGANIVNNWSVTNADTGTVGNVSFFSFENLTGGSGNDSFVFTTSTSKVTGQINGGGGIGDALNYSALTGPVTVNLANGAATATGGISNFERLVGSKAKTDKLIGGNKLNDWLLDGALTGTLDALRFLGFEILTGGTATDIFRFNAGAGAFAELDGGAGVRDRLDYTALVTAISVNLTTSTATGATKVSNIEDATGGSGNDTLVGNTADNSLVGGQGNDSLTGGLGNDSLDGSGGSNTLIESANVNFALSDSGLTGVGFDTLANLQIARLTGGAAANVFIVSDWHGSGTIDGAGGTDRIDAVRDTDMTLTNALLSSIGTPTYGALNLANIETANLSGGTSDNKLIARDFTRGAVTLQGGAGNDVLIGGSSNDSLIGGSGRDLLIGGAGKDTVQGESGEDILIGGTSTLSSNIAAINAIMSEWTSVNNYGTRVTNLTNGVGAGNAIKLNASTVKNDSSAADTLTGGTDTDWFFKSPNDMLDALVGDGQVVTTV